MCGIVGYIGFEDAPEFLLSGMEKLEYRGYDSAGIAVINAKHTIDMAKKVGRLANLRSVVEANPIHGTVGIGHTRWATHGRPSDVNSHPHMSSDGRFAVVHNGIIENFMPLKEQLLQKGYEFKSETDTEVVALLLQELWDGNFESTVRNMLSRIDGSYSLVMLCADEPDKIICTKKDNPLVIGLGKGENFIASDIPAIINHTRDTYIIDDGEFVVLTKDNVSITDRQGNVIDKKIFHVNWNAEAAEKGGYEHFMLKEIHEQPKAFRDTMSGRIAKDSTHSYKNKKQMMNDPSEWQIFENTHEAIIEEPVFEVVQKIRDGRRRVTPMGEMPILSGMLFCADCGNKLYQVRGRGWEHEKEYFVCATYRKIKGGCSSHQIRNVVVEELLLDGIRKITSFARDNEGEFVEMVTKKTQIDLDKSLRDGKRELEQSLARIKKLDDIIQRLYEDNIEGKISDERFAKMTANYEAEQHTLECRVDELKATITTEKESSLNASHFINLVRKYTDIHELTAEVIREFIEKIYVYKAERFDVKRIQHIKIVWNCIGEFDLPTISKHEKMA